MNNNFLKTIWQKIFGIILQITDTFYRLFVRLLYHSKVVGVLSLFWVIIFITSYSFCYTIFYDVQKRQNGGSGAQGFYAIDVGQGDSLLYITKENQIFLIDTGKPGSNIVKKLENILGKYKKKIDVIVLTHPDSDHVGELDNILASYNVGMILYSPIYDARSDSKKSMEEIKTKIKNKNNNNNGVVLPVFAGENLVFSKQQNIETDGIAEFADSRVGNKVGSVDEVGIADKVGVREGVYFLSPPFSGMTTFVNKKELSEDNYFSVVAMIKNKDVIFAMADAPQKIEKVLASSILQDSRMLGVDAGIDFFSHLKNFTGEDFTRNQFDKIILKVGHHGSKTSSAPDFIQKLFPTDAVLSYGIKNRYGHPNKEVLDLLASSSSSSSTSWSNLSFKTKIHRTISGTVYFNE